MARENRRAQLAGGMLKVLRLARMPGMDAIAVKLNCGLTWEEEKEAEAYDAAFVLADAALLKPEHDRPSIFELATELSDKLRR